ncbi:hypothetical protein QC761_0078260, partial [Podospora bellae-mahoneyi]
PALPAIECEWVTFSSAFGIETPPFQGGAQPSQRQTVGLFLESPESTQRRRDQWRTRHFQYPAMIGGYAVQLAVSTNFTAWASIVGLTSQNTDDSMGIEHIDHCIDMLWQSIMPHHPHHFCSDVTNTPMKVVAEVVHTCRSSSKIQQWAWNRRLMHKVDKDTVVKDDPLGCGTYTYTP